MRLTIELAGCPRRSGDCDYCVIIWNQPESVGGCIRIPVESQEAGIALMRNMLLENGPHLRPTDDQAHAFEEPHIRYNHYVVQSQHDVSQFSTLEIARKHAQLNRPASIYRGDQVARIEGRTMFLKASDSTPIEST